MWRTWFGKGCWGGAEGAGGRSTRSELIRKVLDKHESPVEANLEDPFELIKTPKSPERIQQDDAGKGQD